MKEVAAGFNQTIKWTES